MGQCAVLEGGQRSNCCLLAYRHQPRKLFCRMLANLGFILFTAAKTCRACHTLDAVLSKTSDKPFQLSAQYEAKTRNNVSKRFLRKPPVWMDSDMSINHGVRAAIEVYRTFWLKRFFGTTGLSLTQVRRNFVSCAAVFFVVCSLLGHGINRRGYVALTLSLQNQILGEVLMSLRVVRGASD